MTAGYKESHFALGGGLDMATPQIEIEPGFAVFSQNWEPSSSGRGYLEHEGCERFDGRALASSFSDAAQRAAQRALIQPVPGSGPLRGVWIFEGDVYAFRDNAGATACVMHKATTSGWSAVTTPALQPGGRYEFCNYNFLATVAGKAMYGCDGVNKTFEFRGGTFTQITSGVSPDAPKHIAAHQMHLFLGFVQGSVIHSPLGNPTGAYTAVQGAGELGLGDGITALVPLQFDLLGCYGADSIHFLYGTGPGSWALKTHSFRVGAKRYTVQPVLGSLFLDDGGIRSLTQSQAYGDFDLEARSRRVADWIRGREAAAVGSLVCRRKNHYRVYFAAGNSTYELTSSFANPRDMAFMPNLYPFEFTCFCSDVIDGDEWLLAGGADGYVYRLDSGNSMDGQPLQAMLRLPWNHLKSPGVRKRFREAVFDAEARENRTIQIGYELDYGDIDYPTRLIAEQALEGRGAIWGVGNWGQFVWGAPSGGQHRVRLVGSGSNIALVFNTERNGEQPLRINGQRIVYQPRRYV